MVIKMVSKLSVFVDTDGEAPEDSATDNAGHVGETADSSHTECQPGTSWLGEHDLGHRDI